MDNSSDESVCWAVKAYAWLRPVLGDAVFAFGDTCVGAVYYKGPYAGMEELSFCALRADFDVLRPKVVDAARGRGWLVSGADDGEAPYLEIACSDSDGELPLRIYPLDNVPHQSILRFKMLREADGARSVSDYERLRRYNGIETGYVARLFGTGRTHGVMGERTIQQRTIARDALYPLREMEFQGTGVLVPRDLSSWVCEPTHGRKEITRIIQERGLDALEEVDRVCGKMRLRFFLVGGTMLGAVRHGGYIPWDDDIDIGMLRKDYNRFVRRAQGELSDRYFVQVTSSDRHSHFVYARLRFHGIDYITRYNVDKDFDKGLWIDIFPFDAVPRNRWAARMQKRVAQTLARASMGLKRRKEYAANDARDATAVHPVDRGYLTRYCRLARLFPARLCELAYRLAAGFFNPFLAGKKSSRYGSFVPTYTTIEPGELESTRVVDFESTRMPIMCGAERFLERQYGDFMDLPPLHERQTDHGLLHLLFEDGTVVEP